MIAPSVSASTGDAVERSGAAAIVPVDVDEAGDRTGGLGGDLGVDERGEEVGDAVRRHRSAGQCDAAGATLVSDALWPSWATTVRHDAGA